MPGKRDKKDRGKKPRGNEGGGNDLASMFGLGNAGLDVSDADLEAELMALEGKSPSGKKKSGLGKSSKSVMSLEDVNKMVAGIGNLDDDDDEDDDGDFSDMDEDELLGELQALEEDGDEEEEMKVEPTPSPPPKSPAPSPRKSPGNGNSASVSKVPSNHGGGAGAVGEIVDRLDLYKRAKTQAEAAGENSKVRRYKRSIGTLEEMLKSAKRGKPVNLDEMPPPVVIKEAEATPSQDKPHPPSRATAAKPPPPKTASNLINLDDPELDNEFDLTEEEIAAMSTSMVDDRNKTQTQTNSAGPSQSNSSSNIGNSGAPPQPKPRSQPPKAKPAPTPPKPKSGGPAMLPGGMIDLDDPEFDEFNLTDEDIAAMAYILVDDRGGGEESAKKPKIDSEDNSYSLSSKNQTAQPMKPSPSPRKHPPQAASRSKPAPPPAPSQSLPATLKEPVSGSSDKAVLRAFLTERMEQYQSAAKATKDPKKNREYRVMAAKFSRVMKAVDGGQEVDLNQMPDPPPGYRSSYNIDLKKMAMSLSSSSSSQQQQQQQQQSKPAPISPPQGQSSSVNEAPEEEVTNPDIPIPKTALEALDQRLAKYRDGMKTAQENGEGSRVRRMGRIIKQYEAAIKDTKAGRACDYDELPAPPGYPPIPRGGRAVVRPAAGVPLPTQSLPPRAGGGGGGGAQLSIGAVTSSISQEHISLVEQRMLELRRAAKQEQDKGNKDGALHFLKMMKGLDTMLKAAKSGLPVNLEQIPPSPFADISQTKPSGSVVSHLRPATEEDKATFELIIKQLEKQIEICDRNGETYKKMGSNASAIEYENMSQNCQRELLALKGIQMQKFGPPAFSLETRKFTIVHSNTHLNGSVCEIEVVRGLDLTRPPKYDEKDMSVYVEVEFPYPLESPPKKSTDVVSKSCSPEFKDQHMVFDIDRKHQRSMMRSFKRSPLKCTVWQNRSLRKDIFIGVVNIQLELLESKSEIHSIVDLLDERGRKPVGGKLEVFARLREPLTGRDQEECEEQWLVFKESIAAKSSVPMPKLSTKSPPKKKGGGGAGPSSPNYSLLSPVKVEETHSLAALKFEFSLVSSALKGGHQDGATVQRGKLIKARMESLQHRLQADAKFRQAYPRLVTKEIQQEQQLEAQLAKQGKAKQAEVVILQKRRAAMEKEIGK